MAEAAPVRRPGDLQSQVEVAANSGTRERLSVLQLRCTGSSGEAQLAAVYVLKVRAEGFLALLPLQDEVVIALESFENVGGRETALHSQVQVTMETPRGRVLGDGTVIVADIPWYYLDIFQRHSTRVPAGGALLVFRHGDQVARPVQASALAAADAWITTALDEETANEYTDLASAMEGGVQDVEPVPTTPAASHQAPGVDLVAMQARLAQLEAMVQQQAAPARRSPVRPTSMLDVPGVHDGQPLDASELQALQNLAGPAPKRLGKGETAVVKVPQKPSTFLAELDREVQEAGGLDEPVEDPFLGALEGVTDPLHRMLAFQMKQTQDLVKALAPKPVQDPLASILASSDGAGSGSSTASVGVKGYAAREAFLKALENDKSVVATIRANARAELGISEAKEEASLLRTYLETRIPVGDLKTLGQVGYMLAHGWEVAANAQNIQMMAFCGRMMGFKEQASLDGGRTQLAWMLTGLVEPNHQLLAANRRRTGVSPFAKLPSPQWVAANIAYLKDIDHFETRLRQIGASAKTNPAAPAGDQSEAAAKAKGKPKKSKGGKGSNQTPEDPSTTT